jgi:hypothetical protein
MATRTHLSSQFEVRFVIGKIDQRAMSEYKVNALTASKAIGITHPPI